LAVDNAAQRWRSAQIAAASFSRQRRSGGRRLVTASIGLRGLAAILLHQIAFASGNGSGSGSGSERGVGDAIGGMRSFAAVMYANRIGHDEILY
jgi:hypothetical protein